MSYGIFLFVYFLYIKNEVEYRFTANQPLLSHFGTSRRVHFSAYPSSISILIPLPNNNNKSTALSCYTALTIFAVGVHYYQIDSLIPHQTQNPTQNQNHGGKNQNHNPNPAHKNSFQFLPLDHSAVIDCLEAFAK